jgi:hypothetical protein
MKINRTAWSTMNNVIPSRFSTGKEKNFSFIGAPPFLTLTVSVNDMIRALTDFEKT